MLARDRRPDHRRGARLPRGPIEYDRRAGGYRCTASEDGHYVLEIPYADSRDLVGDILRHGAEVVVVSPPALREEVYRQREAALGHYRG